MRMLAERLAPARVQTADDAGWSIDALEAQAFAYLAVRSLRGVSVFDRVTERFTNYRPDPTNAAPLAYSVSAIHQDRSGTVWYSASGDLVRAVVLRRGETLTYELVA